MNIFSLLNKITLSFHDPALEKIYKIYFQKRFLPHIKIAIIFGICLYAFFGFLDVFLYDEIKDKLLSIRFKYIIPFLLTIFLLLNYNIGKKFLQSLLAIGIFAGGIGIIGMIRVIQKAGYENNIYFSGLLLVAFFSYTFFRLRFILASVTGILIIAGYELVSIYITHIPIKILVANNFFLITTNIIGMATSYILELDSRKYFLLYSELQKEKESLVKDKIMLEKLAHIDGLTDIPNKRFLIENLKLHWKNNVNKNFISVLIIDVDYFKKFNDLYGHIEGDRCLKKIASTLKNLIRESKDIVARFGGEEFVILLPETDKKNAILIAERARKEIYNLKIPHKGSDISNFVTVSIGVASTKPDNNINFEDILIKADRALYKAKNSGRNRVCTE